MCNKPQVLEAVEKKAVYVLKLLSISHYDGLCFVMNTNLCGDQETADSSSLCNMNCCGDADFFLPLVTDGCWVWPKSGSFYHI